LSNGTVKFEVTSQIVAKGDLPHPHVFVVEISDSIDPKDDVLVRVATPFDLRRSDEDAKVYVRVEASDLTRIGADTFAKVASRDEFTRLYRDRVVAQRNGQKYYLTTTVSMLYDDVTTADAAAKQIRDRVSTLVKEWRSVFSSFVTNPYQDYALPQLPSSVEAERVKIFNEKRAARLKAEAARDEALRAKERCEMQCTADKVIHAYLVADVAALEQAAAVVAGLSSSDAKDFVLRQGAFAADNRSYASLLLKKQNELEDYAARVQRCAVQCEQLKRSLNAAQEAVDAARTAERAALDAVLQVCPTFNPT
jgi:hypothetical protein